MQRREAAEFPLQQHQQCLQAAWVRDGNMPHLVGAEYVCIVSLLFYNPSYLTSEYREWGVLRGLRCKRRAGVHPVSHSAVRLEFQTSVHQKSYCFTLELGRAPPFFFF